MPRRDKARALRKLPSTLREERRGRAEEELSLRVPIQAQDSFQSATLTTSPLRVQLATAGKRAEARATDQDGLVSERTAAVFVDDAIFVTAEIVGGDPQRVGVTQRPFLVVSARDDAGNPVAGATVAARVVHVSMGAALTSATGTTNGQGIAVLVLPYDVGGQITPNLGFNLVGEHRVDVTASAPSRAGAPDVGEERADASAAYVVAAT